jgi:hypothetical protein
MEYFLLLVVVTKQVSLLPRTAISRAQAGVNELNIGCDALSFCVNFIQGILVMLALNIEWHYGSWL